MLGMEGSNSFILTVPLDVNITLSVLQTNQLKLRAAKVTELVSGGEKIWPHIFPTLSFFHCPTAVLNFSMQQKHLKAMLRRTAGPTSRVQVQEVWGKTCESLFLISSQVILVLLVLTQSENRRTRLLNLQI